MVPLAGVCRNGGLSGQLRRTRCRELGAGVDGDEKTFEDENSTYRWRLYECRQRLGEHLEQAGCALSGRGDGWGRMDPRPCELVMGCRHGLLWIIVRRMLELDRRTDPTRDCYTYLATSKNTPLARR